MPLLWNKVPFHQRNQELLALQSTSLPVTKRFHCRLSPSSPLVKKLPTIKIKHCERSTNENSLTLPVHESSWSLGKYHPLSSFLWWKSEFLQRSSWFSCQVIKSPLFSTLCCGNLITVRKEKVIKIYFFSPRSAPHHYTQNYSPPAERHFSSSCRTSDYSASPAVTTRWRRYLFLPFFFFFFFFQFHIITF